MPWTKRTDRLWRFVGTEVQSVSDLTHDHVRAAYGLNSTRGANSNDTVNDNDNNNDHTSQESLQQQNQLPGFPYCGNKYEYLSESPSTTTANNASKAVLGNSSGAKCTASRCKENPNCLNYLGQNEWESEVAFENYRAVRSFGVMDPKLLERKVGRPAGLKNLGATCYASSLLQCWFQDYEFRNTIYQCQLLESDGLLESMPLYQLQLLFGFLDCGLQNVYNPESLVKALKLDTGIQQDAQEFCSLFLNLLDRQLEAQDNKTIQNFVKDHFRGHYSYKTKCSKCGTEKSQKCAFYDIMVNIKDKCTLSDCLDEFIEAEELTGSDRYRCSVCDSLQDATRSIEFEELPDVLNISLMRYHYDKETWLKKKSFDMVRFPETMDFSDYLNASTSKDRKNQNNLFDLTAVLVHSGTSAYSGHYMANVWNPALSQWTLLNDEQVEVFDKDAIFDPDAYTGIDGHLNNLKKPKAASRAIRTDSERMLSTLSTKNAYLLTYTRRKPVESKIQPLPPPGRVMEEVKKQNEEFKGDLARDEQRTKDMRARFEEERNALRKVYQHWHVSDDNGPCYYVATHSLEKYVENPDNIPLPTETAIGLANTAISCEHGKLCPLSFTKAKRITKKAGLQLINDRMDVMAPILTDQDLCEACVTRQVQEILYSMRHRKDIEEFERKSKSTRSPPTVWVSKVWLTEWQKKSPKFRTEERKGEEVRRGSVQDDPSPVSGEYLSHVYCSHGNLSVDKTRRKLVNKSAFEVLSRVFGELRLPQSDVEECSVCMVDQAGDVISKQHLIHMAANEKKELAGLAMRGHTPPHRHPGDKFYVISRDFLHAWLAFIKRPSILERPTFYDNSKLLCEHNGLLYNVLCDEDVDDSEGIALLREEEWAFLSTIYQGDPEIFFVEPPPAQDEASAARYLVDASHPLCEDCWQARRLSYDSTEITIRMMTKSSYAKGELENVQKVARSDESSSTSSPTADTSSGSYRNEKGASKKRTVHPITYSTRPKRLKKTNGSSNTSDSSTKVKTIKININKTDTVMDLKLKIMQKTDVVPLYQQLMWNKAELDKNEATMGSLGILPHSTLDMIIFEETEDQSDFTYLSDVNPPTEPTGVMDLG